MSYFMLVELQKHGKYEVPAHIGIKGNEAANTAAKKQTGQEWPELKSLIQNTTHPLGALETLNGKGSGKT